MIEKYDLPAEEFGLNLTYRDEIENKGTEPNLETEKTIEDFLKEQGHEIIEFKSTSISESESDDIIEKYVILPLKEEEGIKEYRLYAIYEGSQLEEVMRSQVYEDNLVQIIDETLPINHFILLLQKLRDVMEARNKL